MLYLNPNYEGSLADMLRRRGTDEELHPELKSAIVESSFGTPIVHHRYVISIFYTPAENHRLNMTYQIALRESSKAIVAGYYDRYVFIHERPYRLQAFMEVRERMDDSCYWNLLRDIWIDSESPYINIEVWKRLFSNKRRKKKRLLIDKADRKAWKELPDVLTIYRGVQHDGPDTGMSWTLSKEKAIFFAKRFANGKETGRVLEKQICKSEAIAYFNGRSEQEIIHW